jgi:hypothetical protein
MFSSKKYYRVKLKGRSAIEYSENKRKIVFDSEFLTGDAGIVIYTSVSNHWLPPYESETIDPIRLEQIKKNILEDLLENGIKAEWS